MTSPQEILNVVRKIRPPQCGVIVIDNFYSNVDDVRTFALSQSFEVRGNYPGSRTLSFANENLKQEIQRYVLPFGGKITEFRIPTNTTEEQYNGSFQYTTSRDRSWVHIDGNNNWAGIVFLTPDAPLSSGTGFFKFKDGTMTTEDTKILNNMDNLNAHSQDMTKWELVDRVGNIYNRLVLFNANRFHMSMDYFGTDKYNGRLFQLFFFSTEY